MLAYGYLIVNRLPLPPLLVNVFDGLKAGFDILLGVAFQKPVDAFKTPFSSLHHLIKEALPEEGVEFIGRGFEDEELPRFQVFPGKGFSDSDFAADFEG